MPAASSRIVAVAIPGRRRHRQQLHRIPDPDCHTLLTASGASATNLKVAGVSDFDPGQTIRIAGNPETAVIATIGTAGATTMATATDAGATVIPVASAIGFNAGQTITLGSGADEETAAIASMTREGFGTAARGTATITVAAPLRLTHAAGAQVSGTGITLTAALTREHAIGAQISDNVATPGAPNKYSPRRP
jgi:hypothetical protein